MGEIVFEKYYAGQLSNQAHKALWNMVKDEYPDKLYTQTIRKRVKGELADICTDNYYIARDGEKCVCRLWTGWGKHNDAIGNFGHFLTLPEYRGKGVGRQVLKLWAQDIFSRSQLPLGLFCTATASITEIYRPYGFREIAPDRQGGYLYCPLGDSPQTFEELCNNYYKPSEILMHKPASMEFRHEVDCLLRFALSLYGDDDFAVGEYHYLEELINLNPKRVGMLFSKDGHCVGWTFDGQVIKLHPLYKNSKIIDTVATKIKN